MGHTRVPGVEARAGRSKGPSLIPALYAIQDRCGWLPRGELEALARDTRRPLYEIEGLVSFYPHFRTEQPPPLRIELCRDLACWLRGSDERIGEVRTAYADDADVELREVSCPGRCDLAPAATVNEQPVRIGELAAVLESQRAGAAADLRTVGYRPPGDWPNDPYSGGTSRYAKLRALLAGQISAEDVVAALTDAGLRGMGGAGFPTGKKWALVAGAADPVRFAVCNADESEPGTFKDRQILAEQPHLVLEGMLLGMVVVGAEEGWVFIRHEYGPEAHVLRKEITRLRDEGLLGADVLGSGRRLELDVFTSPGGYILGEETALLECMEGHRGEPRNKPPFPGTYGLWGRPTLMNSVETFAHVPVILARGPQWWREQGRNGCEGLKFFAVSGHLKRPGVYCVPAGTTIGELIDVAGGVLGGRPLGAVQPGGASSNFLGPEHLDVPLDFGALADAGSMLGSGAVVVLAEGTDLLAAATNVLRFFRNESCGKCVPCRVGTHKAHTMLEAVVAAGDGIDDTTRSKVLQLETVLRKTSLCGLGQVALGPVVSVLGPDRGATAARDQPRE